MFDGMPLSFCLKLVKSANYSIALLVISTIQPIVLYLLGCIPPCSLLGLSVRPDLETLIVELLPLTGHRRNHQMSNQLELVRILQAPS